MMQQEAELREGQTYRDYANGYAFKVLELTRVRVRYKILSSGRKDVEPRENIEPFVGKSIVEK